MTQRNKDPSQAVSHHLSDDDSSEEEGQPSALNARLLTQQLFQDDQQSIPLTQKQPNADDNSEDEFDDGGLLTQFLGPSKLSKRRSSTTADKLFQLELEKLHEKYLRDTETLDRAKAHLDSLQKAADRGRIPAKMTINIKPLVINKDNEQFKMEWQSAIQESERKLLKTVIDHLQRTIEQTTADIRRSTKETYQKLKANGDKDKAKQQLEKLLTQANAERQQKTEQRIKRKREFNDKAAAEKPNKKAKPND